MEEKTSKFKALWKWFNGSNTSEAKLARTIFQGIVGVLVSAAAIYSGSSNQMVSLLLCPLTMAVLSPLQAYIGTGGQAEQEEADDK